MEGALEQQRPLQVLNLDANPSGLKWRRLTLTMIVGTNIKLYVNLSIVLLDILTRTLLPLLWSSVEVGLNVELTQARG